MSAFHQHPDRAVAPFEYAAGLYNHAVSRLDSSSLHAWMIWRLILDCGLNRADAAQIADSVLIDMQPLARVVSRNLRAAA